jgi:hypothetical protein
MGIRITEEAKVLVDGRAPRGLRERLWAWLVLWQVNRQVKLVTKYAGLTPDEKVRRSREDLMGTYRRRKWTNGLTTALAAVSVPLHSYAAYSHNGMWKLAYLAAVYFSYRSVQDFRTWREMWLKERELVVEDVHDR